MISQTDWEWIAKQRGEGEVQARLAAEKWEREADALRIGNGHLRDKLLDAVTTLMCVDEVLTEMGWHTDRGILKDVRESIANIKPADMGKIS